MHASSAFEGFSRINHMLDHSILCILYMFTDHNELEINKKETIKYTNYEDFIAGY